MPWGRLDDKANANAKLLALSDPAWRMWGCGLIYCQNSLTDGFIPQHAIESFGVRARNKSTVADELCRALVPGKSPLWHRVEGGFQIHDYLEWNDSREEVLAERERNRKRVEKFRSGRGNGERNALQPSLPNAFGTVSHVPQPQTPVEEHGSAPAPTAERRTAADRSPISRLLDRHSERYESIVGVKPHITRPKDPKLLAEMLKQHGIETLLGAMDAMFDHADQFIVRNGYSIGVFKSQINGFLAKSAPRQEKGDWYGHIPHCQNKQDCTKRMLAEERAKKAASA
jgi:hypothetical protein